MLHFVQHDKAIFEMTSSEHALAVEHLPPYHSDPFDRLLVAQAKLEGFTLVTHDKRLKSYAIKVLEA